MRRYKAQVSIMPSIHALPLPLLEHILGFLAPCNASAANTLLLVCRTWNQLVWSLPQLLPIISLPSFKLQRAQQLHGGPEQLAAMLAQRAGAVGRCHVELESYWPGGRELLGCLLAALGRGGVRELELQLPANDCVGAMSPGTALGIPKELWLARSLIRLQLELDYSILRCQVPSRELTLLSCLTSLNNLELSACLVGPISSCTFSSLAHLTHLSLRVPLAWGASGQVRLSGQHLAGCTVLRTLAVQQVTLAVTSQQVQRPWACLERLCLEDVNVEEPAQIPQSADEEGLFGVLPTLPMLHGVTVAWRGSSRCNASRMRSSLSGCTALQELNLCMYPLGTLPQLHPVLTSLTLRFASVTAMPPAENLRGLRCLRVAYCSQLPPGWLGQLAPALSPLRHLSVQSSGLIDLPTVLEALESLQELSLEGTRWLRCCGTLSGTGPSGSLQSPHWRRI